MRFVFMWIGETKDPLFLQLETRYRKRLQHFFSTETTSISEGTKKDRRQLKADQSREAQRVQARLGTGCYLVVLDSTGEQVSSTQLARRIDQLMSRGMANITFLVGGPGGLPEQLSERADWKLSLGRLTLPHEMARVVLLEQVYRAMTILRGFPYHK